MNRLISFIRQPVKRQGAEQYLLALLLSFALSVTLTRLFLELTGYPQLGGGPLHIAHVLWGGLLLFVAALLPLVTANRWAYMAGAILAGTGVGLFIDEVGKFITQENDYFYPLAAPIVYAFFLLTVMLYLRIRRPPSRSARAELYRALDAMGEVLEHDLDETERAELEERLRYVIDRSTEPVLTQLAHDLLDFLHHESLELADRRPTLLERIADAWHRFEERWLNRLRYKSALIGGLFALGLISLGNMLRALPFTTSTSLQDMLLTMIEGGQVTSLEGLAWFLTRLALESSVGVLLMVAAGLLIAGRDEKGTTFAYIGLLLSLTMVNLLVFYFDQFSAIVTATVQLVLLLSNAYYRQHYLPKPVEKPAAPPEPPATEMKENPEEFRELEPSED